MPKTVADEIAEIKDEDTRFMAQQFYEFSKGKILLSDLGEFSWSDAMRGIARYENYGRGEIGRHMSTIAYWKAYLEVELGEE